LLPTVRAPNPLFRLLWLAVALALGASATGAAEANSPSARRDEVQHRLEQKKALIERAKATARALGAEIAVESERIDAVEDRIAGLAAQLGELQGRLAAARRELAALDARLAEQAARLRFLRRQLVVAQQRLAQRVVEIYTADRETDLLALVLEAENLGDVLDRVELYARVAEEDAKIVAAVEAGRAGVARARLRTRELRRRQAAVAADLARRTREQEAAQASLIAERDRLAALRSERQRSLASLQVRREQWEAEADALEAESARLAGLIAAARRAPAPSLPGNEPGDRHFPTPSVPASSSGGLIWPLSGTVVSPFGTRWGRLHAGIDIAAPAGTPVVAAAAGTVIYAGWMGGYGLIVVIQHPNGLATAYAHNSSLAVSAGESVAQGQTIASVGCTGRCFGNHVHFEVRVGGSPVDPMGYL